MGWEQIAAGAIGQGMAMMADGRQLQQQNQLNKQAQGMAMRMSNFNYDKQMQMWRDTNYAAQSKEIERAGLNKALLYAMKGAGGATNSVATESAKPTSASASGTTAENVGMGMQLAMMSLQKDLIKAETENKEANTKYTEGAQTENTKMDTVKKEQEQYKTGLENAVYRWLYGMDEKQNGDIESSTGGTMYRSELEKSQAEAKYKEDVNVREETMNRWQIRKLEQEIDLMKKKGMTEMQILENLKKDGTLKDAEIEWNKVGLTKETLGQLVIGLLKGVVK